MSSTYFFKDIGKNAKDILTKDIPTNEQLKLNTSYQGVKMAFTGETRGIRAAATVEPSYTFPKQGIELKGTWKSSGEISGTASFEKLTEGLKVSTTVKQFVSMDKEKQEVQNTQLELASDYKWKRNGAFTSQVILPTAGRNVEMKFSAMVFKNFWGVGAGYDFGFDLEKSQLAEKDSLSAGVQYNDGVFVGSFVLAKSRNNLLGTFRYFRCTGKHTIGTEVTCNHATSEVNASVALSTRADCGAVSKIVVDTKGDVLLSWKKRVDANTNVTLGCKANTASRLFNVGIHVDVDM